MTHVLCQLFRLCGKGIQELSQSEIRLDVLHVWDFVALRALYRFGVRNSINAVFAKRVLARQQLRMPKRLKTYDAWRQFFHTCCHCWSVSFCYMPLHVRQTGGISLKRNWPFSTVSILLSQYTYRLNVRGVIQNDWRLGNLDIATVWFWHGWFCFGKRTSLSKCQNSTAGWRLRSDVIRSYQNFHNSCNKNVDFSKIGRCSRIKFSTIKRK